MKTTSFYEFPKTDLVSRKDKCAFCLKLEGNLVGKINYIGLGDFDMVQCGGCGLVSIDPVPSAEIVEKGCARLYQLQQPNEKRERILRGFSKSLRRGARFARKYLTSHKQSVQPFRLLEIGAGDGYFSQGIKKEIPGTEIVLLDIVPDLTSYYESQFGCETKTGEFGAHLFKGNEKFDLVIFRDLLEHVRNPFETLKLAHSVLKPKGRILFITPNGREDFWMINQRWINGKQPTLLMLNHFHYFLPETLASMLSEIGFSSEVAFKWGLKHHRKGLGWKQFQDATPFSVPEFNSKGNGESFTNKWKHRLSEVSKAPLNDLGLLSKAYSLLVDRETQKVSFSSPKGHEFFVVALRNS